MIIILFLWNRVATDTCICITHITNALLSETVREAVITEWHWRVAVFGASNTDSDVFIIQINFNV